MKLIQVTTSQGKKCIINIANVTAFFETNEFKTTIGFPDLNDYTTVDIPIDELAHELSLIDDSKVLWVIN